MPNSIGYTPTNYAPIRVLRDLKKTGRSYSIDFFVQEVEVGEEIWAGSGSGVWDHGSYVIKSPLPEGFMDKPIGRTKNPNYDAQLAAFRLAIGDVIT